MATLNLKTVVDTDQAEKNVTGLESQMSKLIKMQEKALTEQKDLANDSKKAIDKNTEATKSAEKGVSKLRSGFKGLGLAIKAAGIGIVIGLLSQLQDIFMQNQKVADKVAETFETVSIVFNELVSALVNTATEIEKNGNGFAALGKVMKGLITIALTPLKLIFLNISNAVTTAQLAWEKSFFGDDDPETVRMLTDTLRENQQEIIKTGKEALEAGRDIVVNFAEAAESVGGLVQGTMEKTKDISISAARETAKANVELKNNAMLAAAQQQRLLEQYDRQAEKLRQIRDDDRLTFEQRMEANEALGEVLQKQEEAMLMQADLQIQSAQADLNKNESIQNQIALTEALTNREGILAQIEGFRSEQLMNRNALEREMLAEQEENEKAVLEAKKQRAEEAAKIEKERIEKEIDLEKRKEDAKKELISKGFAIAQEIAGENFEVQKGIAGAQALYDTYVAVNKTLSTIPAPFNIPLAIATGAFGLLQVRKIAQTQPNSDGASGGGSISGGATAQRETQQQRIPNVDFANRGVGGGQGGLEPARAYVVNQEIKDKSKLAQRIEDSARLG